MSHFLDCEKFNDSSRQLLINKNVEIAFKPFRENYLPKY